MKKIAIFDKAPGKKSPDGKKLGHNLGLMKNQTYFPEEFSIPGLKQLVSLCEKSEGLEVLLLHTTDLKSVLGHEAPKSFAKMTQAIPMGVRIVFFSGGGPPPEDYRVAFLNIEQIRHVGLYNASEVRKILIEYYLFGDPDVFISSTQKIAVQLLNVFMLFSWLYELHLDKRDAVVRLINDIPGNNFDKKVAYLMAANIRGNNIEESTKDLWANHKDWLDRLSERFLHNESHSTLKSNYIVKIINELCECDSSNELNDKIFGIKKLILSKQKY